MKTDPIKWFSIKNSFGLLVQVVSLLTVVAFTDAPAQTQSCRRSSNLIGANLSGAEYNGGNNSAVHGKDYIYPTKGDVSDMKKLGFNVIRLPFLWERIQPELFGDLNRSELGLLNAAVSLINQNGMSIILDIHNYGSYKGRVLGTAGLPDATLADLWKRLAMTYADNSMVIFGLMNEPVGMSLTQWSDIARQSVKAIRSAGAKNLILVPGGDWSGAHGWLFESNGVSNAKTLSDLAKTDDKLVFEVHQYFDSDYSGTHDTCVSNDKVHLIFSNLTDWARANRVRLFLGEFGVPKNDQCLDILDQSVAYLNRNADVWTGWTYFAGGTWFGNHPFTLQPSRGESPQAKILAKYANACAS